MELHQHPKGNYHFLAGIAPYSSAVIADERFTLFRFQLVEPLPYRDGFERIARVLDSLERPKQALCAVELRLPAPLPFTGFIEFNESYCDILRAWNIYVGDANPVARTNVAPEGAAPAEPSLYAFTVTFPRFAIPTWTSWRPPEPAFVIAGAGDLRDQSDLRPEAIVRPNETSLDALTEKAATVHQVMSDRLGGIGRTWTDVTTTNVYTIHPLHPLLQSTLLSPLGAAAIHGVNWYYSRPPIAGLEFEMDLRRVGMEIQIS